MVAVRQAALVSDESALEVCACSRRRAIQIDDLYLYLYQSGSLLLHHQEQYQQYQQSGSLVFG